MHISPDRPLNLAPAVVLDYRCFASLDEPFSLDFELTTGSATIKKAPQMGIG
jgi:hypothetical protein